jgi:MFS family permease
MTETQGGTRYAWYVVCVLLLLNVSSFIDRQVLFLLTTAIQADLGLTDTQMSLIQGPAFAFTFAFAVFIVGRLADRRSRTAIIAWGVAFWSAMCTLTGVANTYGQLFATRVGVGAGEAALSPTAATLIADYFPPERLATAMSVFTSGVFFGSGLAYFIGGTVIELVSNQSWSLPFFGDVRPWQRVFIAVGLPGFLLALLTLTIREPRRNKAREAQPTFTLGEVMAWFRRHGVAYVTFGVAISLYAVVNFGTAAWFPAYFERVHEWSRGKVGLFMGGATAIFGVIGVIAGGRFADFLKSKGHQASNLQLLMISAVISAMVAFPLFLTKSEPVLLTALVITNIVAAAPFGAAAAAMQEMSPRAMRGIAASVLVFLLNFIGLTLGPPAVALVTDNIFKDPTKVGLSLLLVTLVGRLIAALSVAGGLAAHRVAVTEVASTRESNLSRPPKA